jgi:hypothetical protein
VPSYPQRDEAEFLIASVPGVTGMRNDVTHVDDQILIEY